MNWAPDACWMHAASTVNNIIINWATDKGGGGGWAYPVNFIKFLNFSSMIFTPAETRDKYKSALKAGKAYIRALLVITTLLVILVWNNLKRSDPTVAGERDLRYNKVVSWYVIYHAINIDIEQVNSCYSENFRKPTSKLKSQSPLDAQIHFCSRNRIRS